jgi:hypothetical protein
MNKTKPEVILNWLANYSDLVKSKILVCGGDGSVGWILEIISKIKFKVKQQYLYLRLNKFKNYFF